MKKKLVITGASVVLAALLTVLFFTQTLWILPSMRAAAVVDYDVFRGAHMQLGKGAAVYTVEKTAFVSADDLHRCSVYRFSLRDADGILYEAEFSYPGTPKRQYAGYPRLRSSMHLLVLAHPDDVQNGKIHSGWLFVTQTVDGEDFVYPLYYDASVCPYSLLGERVPFAYIEESRIYHPWYDADVLQITDNREYACKLRLEDFLRNYPNILR